MKQVLEVKENVKISNNRNLLNKVLRTQEVGILIPLIVICVVTGIINPVFLGTANIIDLMRSISFTVIIGVGMTFILISGGLDLSVGSAIGLTGMITGWALVNGIPVPVAIGMGLAGGFLIGLINGLIVVKLRIPPLIVTLGMMYIARGVIYVMSKGRPYYPFPDAFNKIGQGTFLNVPYSVYIALVIVIIGHFILNYTVFGRSVMALGGNEEATRVSGISINKIKVMVYCITSMLCAVTGILMASRLSSSQANGGTGWEMTVIASVIIGGTSLFGGFGSILGTLIGTAIMTVLSNAMVLMGVSVYWQNIVVGIIIILAVGIDTYKRNAMSGNGR